MKKVRYAKQRYTELPTIIIRRAFDSRRSFAVSENLKGTEENNRYNIIPFFEAAHLWDIIILTFHRDEGPDLTGLGVAAQ
jgi:hypothetical protein